MYTVCVSLTIVCQLNSLGDTKMSSAGNWIRLLHLMCACAWLQRWHRYNVDNIKTMQPVCISWQSFSAHKSSNNRELSSLPEELIKHHSWQYFFWMLKFDFWCNTEKRKINQKYASATTNYNEIMCGTATVSSYSPWFCFRRIFIHSSNIKAKKEWKRIVRDHLIIIILLIIAIIMWNKFLEE